MLDTTHQLVNGLNAAITVCIGQTNGTTSQHYTAILVSHYMAILLIDPEHILIFSITQPFWS